MTDTRWHELSGGDSGAEYAARFEALARQGTDVHGEAAFCAALVGAGSRVLDAGCGTGRVTIRLAELGYDCVGVDVDESMLAVARARAPSIPWHTADLATLSSEDLHERTDFDLVLLAGNVVPLLAPGTTTTAVAALARLLVPGGVLVAGFGLDAAHLPRACPVTALEEYDAACLDAGLRLRDRFGTWDGAAYDGGGYAVSVHGPGSPPR